MRKEGGVMSTVSKEDMWKKTVADMQGEIHALQKTIVRLQKQLNELSKNTIGKPGVQGQKGFNGEEGTRGSQGKIGGTFLHKGVLRTLLE